MKKRDRVLISFFILVSFLLCSCDKNDYKKAVKADEAGEFETAIELYTKLSQKNYKDSRSRLDNIKIRRALVLRDEGKWDEVDCYLFWGDYSAEGYSGEKITADRCFFEKARYLQENGRHEEALAELSHASYDDVPEGFDRGQMYFDSSFALCRTIGSEDERFDCLGKMNNEKAYYPEHRYEREWVELITEDLKEHHVYYEEPEISRPLFMRQIGASALPAGERSFGQLMDRCLAHVEELRLSKWLCKDDYLFDMIYFADGDPVEVFRSAEHWAEEQGEKEAVVKLAETPKRCLSISADSEYSGITHPIDAPAACNAVFVPELETWLRENLPGTLPSEGFWDSDTFFRTFGFDESDARMDSFYRIAANFKASDPLPRTITIIVSSDADFDRPNASWREHPETTEALTEWINKTVSRYKNSLPEWRFIDDPARASFIMYLRTAWNPTGTFSGKAAEKHITVQVYNLEFLGDMWSNLPGSGNEKTSFTVGTNLGEENTIQGVQKDLTAQHLTIISEDPLKFDRAEYDPVRGMAWPVSRPLAFTDSTLNWLRDQDSKSAAD